MPIKKWILRGVPLALLAAGLMLPYSSAFANCGSSLAVSFGSGNQYYTGCGTNTPTVFLWRHKAAIQRVINGEGVNPGVSTTTGNDSGDRDYGTDPNVLFEWPTPGQGSYLLGSMDSFNTGMDGCIIDITEGSFVAGDANCCSGNAASCVIGPVDVAFSGLRDVCTLDPTVDCTLGPSGDAQCNSAHPGGRCRRLAEIAVSSVDFNPTFALWSLDQAGAPPQADQTCANLQASNGGLTPCFPIPEPTWNGVVGTCAPSATTCTVNVSVGDVSGFLSGGSLATDCNVAESRPTNCTGPASDPRNLFVGRRLFFKRGSCVTPGTPNGFDRHIYTVATFTDGAAHTIPLNFNDVAPIDVPGAAATTVPVALPRSTGTPDSCIYVAMGLVFDQTPLAGYEQVVSPYVTVNPIPFRGDTTTPVSDQVFNIVAKKSQGKVTVSWETSAEMSTAGFNLIGTKKGGSDVALSTSIIPAKEGTSGKGALYTVDVAAGQMKGSDSVSVQLLKTDNSKERFGPAPIR